VFRNNIVVQNEYGVSGSGKASGRRTLEAFFPGSLFVRNVVVGGDASTYPPDNLFARSIDQVGFVDRAKGDYRLAKSSRFLRAATDGKDAGADFSEGPGG
jgi:hypothetical protein